MEKVGARKTISLIVGAVAVTLLVTAYSGAQTRPGEVSDQAGKAAEAEETYREDLKRHPANGWSLYGLLASLRAQGKVEEAKAVEKRFRDVWRLADITLTSSRF